MSSDTQTGVHEGNPSALQKANPGQPDAGIRLVICPGLDLCGAVFVHSWVWLLKAQNIPEKYVIRRARMARDRGIMDYSIENNAMIED